MKKRVAILHYSYPPVIGGVEFIIRGHASVLAEHGHPVRIIAGAGESGGDAVEFRLIEEIAATAGETKLVQEELSRGIVSDRFERLRKRLASRIAAALAGVGVCFIHNVLTMHFNLALDAALADVVSRLKNRVRFYAWCHDATLLNPDYALPFRRRYPWRLITGMLSGVRYVAISRLRQRQLAKLFGAPRARIRVVPDGIDVKTFLGITDSIWRFALEGRLLEQDLVLFYPSRILRRKNYELAIQTVGELARSGRRVKLVMTGAPDPHNPSAALYWRELRRRIRRLGLGRYVVLMHDLKKRYGDDFRVGYRELRNLYDLSDMLFITSRQEGFGIPLLEAGSKRVPIACSAIPPFKEVASSRSLFFGLDERPAAIARRIIGFARKNPTRAMFRKVLREYSWEAIYREHLRYLVR